jgi:hypothetical protein
MKIGIIISMYDEIDIVKETISNLKNKNTKVVVIQSDPGNKKIELDESICDKYEKMSDVSGGRDKYAKIIEEKKEGKGEIIGPIALTRNFSRGFSLIRDFDIDYVIAITGDTKITNLKGITKIIEKMKKDNKIIGGTRTIGFTMYDEFGKFTQFQHRKITNIMPQFFLADINSVRKGLFCSIKKTNKFTTEQCFGDEINHFCIENNLKFFETFYRICDYGYPRFINGIHYNPEQISKIPPPFEGIINWIRYWSNRSVNNFLTRIFLKIENNNKHKI